MEYFVLIIKDTGRILIKGKHATLDEAIKEAKALWRSLPPYNTDKWDVEVRGYKAGYGSEYTVYDWE